MPMKWLQLVRRTQEASTRAPVRARNGAMTTASLLPTPMPETTETDTETAAQRDAIDWAWSLRSEMDPAGDLADIEWPDLRTR